MAKKNSKLAGDPSTEEKIKNAARTVFHQKGFAATRTRDIAEEAGINLALLNYYFRSKENLFDIIMLESLQGFLRSVSDVFNDDQTTLDNKIDNLVDKYIDQLTANPNMPLFLLSELKSQPDELVAKLGMKEILMQSSFLKQFHQAVNNGKVLPVHPLHFLMNLISMTVFPFIASPVLKGLGDLSQQDFDAMMQQRKLLIPKWIKATLKAT